MVFAAQKLRLQNELHAPTVVIVDDRIDLEDQITGDFTRADIPNIESAKTKDELVAFFKQDQRKILITTIFKFGDVDSVLNERDNIILLVDEAHRTQEKDLGQKMRNALPNAFFFGLTGTPIDKLPTRCREIFLLHMDGKKNEEIATALGISIETVKTQKKRAIQSIKEQMGTCYFLLPLCDILYSSKFFS